MKLHLAKVMVVGMIMGSALAANGPECGSASSLVDIKTNRGDIILKLNPKKSPITVANFCAYVKAGKYDGTIFHRVIPNFMIQGGGFTRQFQKVTTDKPIKNEANNGLKNTRGTIAMARTSIVNSATNQFFINLKDNPFLNHRGPALKYGYAVFGRVVKGMKSVVDGIAQIPTTQVGPFQNAPVKLVVIEKVSVISASELSE